jgi:hypothetical protein
MEFRTPSLGPVGNRAIADTGQGAMAPRQRSMAAVLDDPEQRPPVWAERGEILSHVMGGGAAA